MHQNVPEVMFLKLTCSQNHISVCIIYMLCHGKPFPQKHEGGELRRSYVSLVEKKKAAKKNPTQSATAALQLIYIHSYSTKLFKICPEK